MQRACWKVHERSTSPEFTLDFVKILTTILFVSAENQRERQNFFLSDVFSIYFVRPWASFSSTLDGQTAGHFYVMGNIDLLESRRRVMAGLLLAMD